MPYIEQKERKKIDSTIKPLADKLYELKNIKGNLNYTITMLIKDHINCVGKNYDSLSDITGVLNDVKTEFERKVVTPYEDNKIQCNGDIYDN